MTDFDYHKFLQPVVNEDVRFIKEREKLYKGSWCKSGGRSSWFMLVRKMDRLQEMMKMSDSSLQEAMIADDIFKKIEANPSGDDSTILAEVRDLRRYLTLVEAYVSAKGVVKDYDTKPEANKWEKDDESLHASYCGEAS